MKKFGAYLSLIGILSQSTALAWVGGPYSNNTYDGLDGGVFGGTIRGSNTSGIFKFSQGNEAYVSPFGDSIVYHKGLTYYGECFGQVDFDSKTVSGVTNGSSAGSNQNDPNSSPQYRNLFGGGFGVQNGTATQLGLNTIDVGATAQFPILTANSYWNGKITKSKQTMRFKASGEMSFIGAATETTTFNRVTSTGVFEDPSFDLDTGLNLIGTSSPPGTGTTSRTTGAKNNYPNIMDSVKIRIYGSRTSVTPFGGPAGYAG